MGSAQRKSQVSVTHHRFPLALQAAAVCFYLIDKSQVLQKCCAKDAVVWRWGDSKEAVFNWDPRQQELCYLELFTALPAQRLLHPEVVGPGTTVKWGLSVSHPAQLPQPQAHLKV